MILLAMVFTAAIGFFIYVNQGGLSTLQAQQAQQQGLAQSSSEKLSVVAGLSTVADPWGSTGDLWVRITNVGSVPATLIDVFVINTINDKVVSASKVTANSQYLSTYSNSAGGDLNYSLPITILPGVTTNKMTGCGSGVGCDIGISKSSYAYAGTPVVVSVLTSSGNIFSAQYPPKPSGTVVTTTSTTMVASTSTLPGSNPGGNVLVVQMQATPPQSFSCAHCVNDTVTVYNYGTSAVTSIQLSPNIPIIQSTGTAIITSTGACTIQGGGTNSLPAWSGSGPPPSIVYLCNFKANPNGFGGFVTFTGSANGTYNGSPVTSGEALSNIIQVGGPVSVLNSGPFSANFFYFKYSACTNAPSSGKYASPCTTTPSPVTIAGLPAGTVVSGHSYYVAYYIQITNNYNVTLPILPYSFMFTDPTIGGETAYWISGTNTGSYVPNYACSSGCTNNIPALTAYPSTCVAGSTSTCINVPAGGTVTITFAACDISSSYWNWGGSSYGSSFDSGSNCSSLGAQTPSYQANGATWLGMLISFYYQGQVYTQNIPFAGQIVQ
jgi:hypothetical protein